MNNLLVAASALQHLSPHDRQGWYEAAMMLKSEFGDSAFDVWDEWSQQGATYNTRDAHAVWKSCKPAGGLTIASLYYRAKQSGWPGSIEYTRPDPRIRAARELARKIEQQQAEAEREALHAQTAIKALHRWNSYQAAYLSHEYLQRKEIQPLGLRQSGAALVNPMYGANGLINLQYIWPNGNKRFMKGAQTAGAYTPIGRLGEVFYICEGYSTGATIHQITGRGVLCALSVSNLLLVARRAREDYPAAHIIIAADNDRHLPSNPGVTTAREAALAIGAEVVIPEFPAGHPGTDWNDYYLMEQEAAQ